MDPDENFNLADSVKTLLSEVIPLVEFSKMDKTFLMDFVVAKGILTVEEASRFYYIHVYVRNNGKYVSGIIRDNNVVARVNTFVPQCSTNFCRFINVKVDIPSSPSTLKKTDGIDWYLCLDKEGILTLKHYEAVDQSDYLIAEMKSESEFFLTPNETTYFTSRFNYFNSYF